MSMFSPFSGQTGADGGSGGADADKLTIRSSARAKSMPTMKRDLSILLTSTQKIVGILINNDTDSS